MPPAESPVPAVPLCRLIYKSDTSWDLLTNESLRQLATGSAHDNGTMDITGLLLLSGEHFLQVLEGPADSVNGLYLKIARDKRHTNLVLLSYEQIAKRNFAEWSMHVVDLHELPMEQRRHLTAKFPEKDGYIAVPDDDRTAHALLLDAKVLAASEAERS